MVHSGLRFLLAGVLLCLSAAAWSTSYTITTTADHPDGEGQQGECSLRDALMAINTQADVNGCDAGTGNDRIRLQEGETYQLTAGALQIGGMEHTEDDGEGGTTSTPVNPVVRFVLEDGSDNATIIASEGARVFLVKENAELRTEDLSLRFYEDENGQPGAPVPVTDEGGHGGLIHSAGGLVLRDNTRLLGGRAEGNGGAMYIADSVNVRLHQAMIADSYAEGDGGALYLPAGYSGTLHLQRFHVGNNEALGAGGGLYVQGDNVTFVLESGTIARNRSGLGGTGVHLGPVATSQTFFMNNVTLANNSVEPGGGSAATAGFVFSQATGDDLVSNSVLVGNRMNDGSIVDCDGPQADLLAAFTVSGDTCPDPHPEEAVPVNDNRSLEGDITVLRGIIGQDQDDEPIVGACQQPGADCELIDAEILDGDFPGYLPNFAALADPPALLDAGSPVTGVEFPCTPDDQRGFSRVDRCDVGAHEFQKGSGSRSNFDVIIGQTELLDVVENDLGDTRINCFEIAGIDEADLNAEGILVLDPADDPSCLSLVQGSTRNVNISVQIDDTGHPRFIYDPQERFDGFDFFSYRVNKEAFIGSTFSDLDVGALVTVSSRPESGFTESKDIDDFISSSSPAALLLLMLAGIVRRSRRFRPGALAVTLLLMVGAVAHADEIRVNSAEDNDPFQPQQGVCTLRGAVDSAQDGLPSSSFCKAGTPGHDRIVLPGEETDPADPDNPGPFVISLDNMIQVQRNNRITIEGQGVDRTIIQADQDSDNWPFRLFSAQSGITFRNLTLQLGDAGPGRDGGAILAERNLTLQNVRILGNSARQGGAIYLDFNDDERRNVEIRNAYLEGNQASEDGGVLATVGQTQQHTIEIFDSTFVDNSAAGTGGVLEINFARRSRLDVVNSTFLENSSGAGGSAIDMQSMVEGSRVFLMNSTFLDNSGGTGAFDLGNGEGGDVDISNSVYAGADDGCSTGTGARQFHRSLFNLFTASQAECGAFELDENNDYDANAADVREDLNDGQLVEIPAAEQPENRFIPPFLPMGADATLIVESGNDADLASGTSSPRACRRTDKRGEPRGAGERCDRGAYEFQSPTAGDVAGDNRDRNSRTVILDDIFERAIEGDGFQFVKDSLEVTAVDMGGGQACVLPEGHEDTPCDDQGTIQIDPDEPPENYVIRYEAPGVDDIDDRFLCSELPREGTLDYRFQVESEDDGSTQPVDGTADVTIRNVPPSTHEGWRKFRMEPGETLDIELEAEDPDGPDTALRLSVRSSEKPSFSRRDEEGETIDVGLILPVDMEDETDEGFLLDPTNRTITYKHNSTFQTFRERFRITVTDECGQSRDAAFEITFPKNSSTSDDVLSGSSYWWHLLALLGLGLLRRRGA